MTPISKIEYGVRIQCAAPGCTATHTTWSEQGHPKTYATPPEEWFGRHRYTYCPDHAGPVREWQKACQAHGKRWQPTFHAASAAYREAVGAVPAKPVHPYEQDDTDTDTDTGGSP